MLYWLVTYYEINDQSSPFLYEADVSNLGKESFEMITEHLPGAA